MIGIGVFEAKASLAHAATEVEIVVPTRRGKPLAEIAPPKATRLTLARSSPSQPCAPFAAPMLQATSISQNSWLKVGADSRGERLCRGLLGQHSLAVRSTR